MKKLLNFLFSMQMMGVLIILFAFSIGTATFIENDFGTPAARAMVYDARWFELLLLLLTFNLIANIFRYKLYKREKWSIFIFHASFIVIIIGSAFTRYVGYEGNMHIREGQATNQITTMDSYIDVKLEKNGKISELSEKFTLSSVKSDDFKERISIDGNEIDIQLKTFIPNAQTTLVQDMSGAPVMEMVAVGSAGMNGMQNFTLEYNSHKMVENNLLAFGSNPHPNAIVFDFTDSLRMMSPMPLKELSMMGGDAIPMAAKQWHVVSPRKLYDIGGTKLVIKNFYPAAKFKYVQGQDKNAPTLLVFDIKNGNSQKELIVKGQKDYIGKPELTSVGDVNISIAYGSKIIELPFSLKLNDFQLERYPGSNSPSSFASEVTLIDEAKGIKKDYRIYMNNILNHEGYRFFQASYDTDELGTVLSVNHDRWGMSITYFGYFLLMLGMAWSLINPYSRFKILGRQSRKVKTMAILAFVIGGSSLSANAQDLNVVPLEQAKSFGEVMIQDNGGRFEPVNTLASEVIRKVTKKGKFKGYPAEQIFLSMVVNPQEWQTVNMIKVGNSDLARELGINGKYGAFKDFVNEMGQYKLSKKVQDAYSKKPAHRSSYDKEIMAVDERINITYMVFTGEFLKIFPNPKDKMGAWYNPTSTVTAATEDSLFIKKSVVLMSQALISGNTKTADTYIDGIKKFQKKFGSEVLPSESKQKVEILYNNVNIFKRLFPYYLIIGFFLIIFLVTHILRPNFPIKWVVGIAMVILGVGFLLHTGGLAARWYIAGRAPWSNGFETMTFIAWGCLLAGFIFAKKSKLALAATAVLAGLFLFVAHLSWMNPEVTNLVPVLKSYWLTIHVAIITSSYAFLALAAILGILNLILFNFQNNDNKDRITTIILDLSRISEMTMTIGLYFLTIGTFLGGIWANESWGRYWGWDPKETWALFSILIYSFVLHMRFIPGLKSIYAFNIVSVWSYGAILMTYFGVNYYLSGLHSYAKGDPVPFPTWAIYSILLLLALSLFTYFNYKRYRSVYKTEYN
ncbi:cytochrome C biogenesis protein [Marinifilum breve]|uniref:Cytochrome C biogenesis protein n=1 Tax=Marinifilum breve TaxID=2184082 RepID=A0A2V3ZXU9_9BACT|nr:cytochrome c biogenesis protein CcsA [Marinifilum breve]PXX99025.1 cytochrome C biogenesis protein [Marinifilum breve]